VQITLIGMLIFEDVEFFKYVHVIYQMKANIGEKYIIGITYILIHS